MTQRPRRSPPPLPKTVQPFRPHPGETVQRDGNVGTVVESDEWWDTLLLRGVDIADQVLVDWTAPGTPEKAARTVHWERVNHLEPVKDEVQD